MSVIFILSVVVLILIFVLFTRDQSNRTVQNTLNDLAKTNAELRNEQKSSQQKSFADKVKDAGLTEDNVWEMEPCAVLPYCQFSQANGTAFSGVFHAIERWDGYRTSFSDETASCDQFVMEDGTVMPIDLSLLASVEQNLVKASKEKDPIGLTVYRLYTKEHPMVTPPVHPCDSPAYVMNVHFE